MLALLGLNGLSSILLDSVQSGYSVLIVFVVLIERSFCHPSPCLNGGTCTEIDESYMCVCAQGYKGKNCESE